MLKLLLAFTLSIAQMSFVPDTPPLDRGVEVAATCFSKGEIVDGMNKICYYDCLGSTAAITIKSTQLCPLTIRN